MVLNLARNVFLVVVTFTVLGTVFRVATAPERMQQRRDTARTVCTGSGGLWVQVGRDEICQRGESAASGVTPKKI
jgi:hypothetical protein